MIPFYAVQIHGSARSRSFRFSLYRLRKDTPSLRVLWQEQWRSGYPHMIASKAPRMPTYHFKLTPDGGEPGIAHIEQALHKLAASLALHLDRPVSIQLLGGYQSLPVEANPS